MPLSPELKVMPGVAAKFIKSGVAVDVITSLFKNRKDRILIDDLRRVLAQFEKTTRINLTGFDNMHSAGIVTFNHPNNDILLPGILKLIVQANNVFGKNVSLVMASEIMLFSNLNQKKEIPGSIGFMNRLHGLYGGSIISTPTVESRNDFLTGRTAALRKIFRAVESGNILIIAPEGHSENNNTISPIETFHTGSGAIIRAGTKRHIPTTPVGIWSVNGNNKSIWVNVGEQFFFR